MINESVLNGRHPGVVSIARRFRYGHLQGAARQHSQMFAELAEEMIASLPDDPELVIGLRKLAEAKDCLVFVTVVATETA
jgi:hypothetical protein